MFKIETLRKIVPYTSVFIYIPHYAASGRNLEILLAETKTICSDIILSY